MHTTLQEGKPKRSSSSSMGLQQWNRAWSNLQGVQNDFFTQVCLGKWLHHWKDTYYTYYLTHWTIVIRPFQRLILPFLKWKSIKISPCCKATTLLKNDNRTTSRSKVHLEQRDLKYNMYALGSRWIIAGFKAQWWIGLLLLVRFKLLLKKRERGGKLC